MRETYPSRNGKLIISKLKSAHLSYILDETMSFIKDKSKSKKSKKGASVSKEFALIQLKWDISDLPFVRNKDLFCLV